MAPLLVDGRCLVGRFASVRLCSVSPFFSSSSSSIFFLLLTSVPFVGSRIDTSTPFPFILLQCVCVCVCVCECVCVVDLMNGAVAKKKRTNPVTLIS